MQRTVSLKLVNPYVHEFRQTMTAFRDACQYISICIQRGAPVNRGRLHRRYYRNLREKFHLPSQMAQSVIRVVIGVYRSLKSAQKMDCIPTFRRLQAQFQYNRDWSFSKGLVSLRTLKARRRFRFVSGNHQQKKYLDDPEWKYGGARLIERKGCFYLHITVEKKTPLLANAVTPIGIDRGIRALVVARMPDAVPKIIRGGELTDYRYRMLRLRRRLQEKGTRRARRVLRHLQGREKRFVLDFCRRAAKIVLQYAQRFNQPIIVFENLDGIRGRIRVKGRKNRRQFNSWPFRILKQAVLDKAEELGLPVTTVDPAYTSQRCPACGTISKCHRRRDNYCCQKCKYQNNADVVAATNIGWLWFNDVYRIEPGVLSTTQTYRVQEQDATYKPPI